MLYRIVGIVALDLIVATPPMRRVAAWIMRAPIRVLSKSEFDAGFYLSQMRPHRRRRAAADPILHYCLVGWREGRSPSLRFDPAFYRARNPDCRGNPFLHSFTRHCDLAPQNESDRAREVVPLRAASDRKKTLVFHHARGGGSSKFLALFEAAVAADGTEFVKLRKVPRSDRFVILETSRGLEAHDLVGALPKLLVALSEIGIERILVSHVVDFEPNHIFDAITRIAERFACSIDVILHDYLCVCPRINLVDSEAAVCFAIPSVTRCERCIEIGGSEMPRVDVSQWRRSFASFLVKADNVYTPSQDMIDRLAPHIPVRMTVWAPETYNIRPFRKPSLSPNDILRVAVVGSMNVAKGSLVVAGLGNAILRRGAPVSVELLGESPEHALLQKAGITVRGRYKDEDIGRLLRRQRPHVAFMPAIWPETWSFVLTELLLCELPVFAFDHGAQADRLRAIGREDYLLRHELVHDAEALLDVFLAFRNQFIGHDL